MSSRRHTRGINRPMTMAPTNDVNTNTPTEAGAKRRRPSGSSSEDSDGDDPIKRPKKEETDERDDASHQTALVDSTMGSKRSHARWRIHQMAEDYVTLAGNLMYPGSSMGPYGYHPPSRSFPLERLSTLGLLTSPLRTPTVVETWSPYEIALFEASLMHYGKQFHKVRAVVQTKSTKEIVAFYYMWKKTSHYKQWKRQYVDDYDILSFSSSSDEEGHEGKDKNGKINGN